MHRRMLTDNCFWESNGIFWWAGVGVSGSLGERGDDYHGCQG